MDELIKALTDLTDAVTLSIKETRAAASQQAHFFNTLYATAIVSAGIMGTDEAIKSASRVTAEIINSVNEA